MAWAVCSKLSNRGCAYTCATRSSAKRLAQAIERHRGESAKIVRSGGPKILPGKACLEIAKRLRK